MKGLWSSASREKSIIKGDLHVSYLNGHEKFERRYTSVEENQRQINGG